MKIAFRILILLLAVPAAVHGHSEFFFPRLLSQAELETTGFALVNPDPFTASVTFILIRADGVRVSVTNPPLHIGPGGQLAKLASELFPGAPSGGWVGAVSDAEGMQAFWLNYDSGITFLDGAEATQLDTMGADQVISLVAGQSELNVVNPNGVLMTVNIRLFGDNGQLASVSRQIPMFGGLQSQVSALFPSVAMSQARYIRLQTVGVSQPPMASALLIRNFLVAADSAVVAGANVINSLTTMYLPHVINGAFAGANYTTVIGVANLSSSSQTVTITFQPDGASPREVTRTIPGSGALRETAQDLFGLPTEFQGGWVRVSGTAAITGFAANADSVGGGLAVAPAGASSTNLLFSHIADGPPQWQTGLALLNSGSTPAVVEVYALNPSGSLIGGAASFTLEPGAKIARVIHELIPQTRGVNGGFLFVRTTNNVPLHGIELFYTEDLKVLSNVAAGRLVSGLNFRLPSP